MVNNSPGWKRRTFFVSDSAPFDGRTLHISVPMFVFETPVSLDTVTNRWCVTDTLGPVQSVRETMISMTIVERVYYGPCLYTNEEKEERGYQESQTKTK